MLILHNQPLAKNKKVHTYQTWLPQCQIWVSICAILMKKKRKWICYIWKLILDFVYCEFCLIFDKFISLKIQVQEGVVFFPILCKILQKEQLHDIIIWEYHIISYMCVQKCSLKYPVYHQSPNTKAVTTFTHELWRKQHLWDTWSDIWSDVVREIKASAQQLKDKFNSCQTNTETLRC